MEKADLLFVTKNLSNLLDIPTRIYENRKMIEMISLVELSRDPFEPYAERLDGGSGNISYFTTDDMFSYCIQKYREYRIVVGPFTYFKPSKQEVMQLAFSIDVKKDEINDFISNIQSIRNIQVESVLQHLIILNYLLNGEKISLEDLTIDKPFQRIASSSSKENMIDMQFEITETRSTTKKFESELEKLVEEGNIEGFEVWMKHAPLVRGGKIANEYIRQQKNTFIASATVISRAAIRGGVDYNEALNISDKYINACELMKNSKDILNLMYNMVKTYVELVHRVKYDDSPLKSKISTYVYNHISDRITLDDLCEYLYMTKSNLCLRFKNECSMTVKDFVIEKKIEEGKKLLGETMKPISSISLYLGFSSQAHFSRSFKEKTSMTPLNYRRQCHQSC